MKYGLQLLVTLHCPLMRTTITSPSWVHVIHNLRASGIAVIVKSEKGARTILPNEFLVLERSVVIIGLRGYKTMGVNTRRLYGEVGLFCGGL